MDKISGIVPGGRRFKSVDVSRSQPVRPGAPSFGRPVGRTSQVENFNVGPVAAQSRVDRISISDDAKLQAGDVSSLRENIEMSARPKNDEITKYTAPVKPVVASSVEEMTQKFFSPQKSSTESELKFEAASIPALEESQTSPGTPVSIQQDLSRQNPYSSKEQSL